MHLTHIFSSAALATLALAGHPACAQDATLPPRSGEMELSSGFTPDPRAVALNAGGGDIVHACTSFIHTAPDIVLSYSADNDDLIISVDSTADTALLIRTPGDTWLCDQDSGEGGANPAINLENPVSGAYAIWIGGPSSTAEAELVVSNSVSR